MILVNSNPATIMTDPEFADATYVEPLDARGGRDDPRAASGPTPSCPRSAARPASTSPSRSTSAARSSATASSCSAPTSRRCRLGEDRLLFKQAMEEIGLKVPKSGYAGSLEEARAIVARARLPADRAAQLHPRRRGRRRRSTTATSSTRWWRVALEASPVHRVLIEQSVLGWKEFELEVMRDRMDNAIVVCSVENVDAMGVHTGDSITVAPQQTLSDREYQAMRDDAFKVIRRVGVATGGSNIQFAVDPDDRRARGDRDEPARLALLGAGLEGDRLPDRQDRGAARRRLHARRDPQRHHRQDLRRLRAHARLHRGQDPALGVREVPGGAVDARHLDEVGGRGDGDRRHLPRGAA